MSPEGERGWVVCVPGRNSERLGSTQNTRSLAWLLVEMGLKRMIEIEPSECVLVGLNGYSDGAGACPGQVLIAVVAWPSVGRKPISPGQGRGAGLRGAGASERASPGTRSLFRPTPPRPISRQPTPTGSAYLSTAST